MLGIINNTKLFQYKKKTKKTNRQPPVTSSIQILISAVSLMEKLIRYADMINALKLRD